MTVAMSNQLWRNPPSNVKCAGYDRSHVVPRIVHLGFGNFHRSHQAFYADLLLEQGSGDWGICGVGTMPQDAHMHEAMSAQDCLYTLVGRDANNSSARIVGSAVKYIFGYQDPEAVFQQMADQQTSIVSMTATEGGYCLHSGTGELKLDHPGIVYDLEHPGTPRTIFGYLAEGLDRRRRAGHAPFTVFSCDNLEGNGDTTLRTLLSFCQARSQDGLASWIEQNVAFPNCMVDRITPAPTDELRAFVRQTFGIDDKCPVVHEPFIQWVMEDHFPNGRPDWDKVGVQFTSDVKPWERTKMFVLNATHSAMGYLGYLCGLRYIHEIAQAPAFAPYLSKMLDIEVTPLLPVIPGLDITAYKASVLSRFANPTIGDTALRICMDGSVKLPKFILPSIIGELHRGGRIRGLTLCVAAWLRFLNGIDEHGQEIPIVDPQGDKLQALAREHRDNPLPFLELTDIFGALGQSRRFVEELQFLLKMLYERGAVETLKFVCNGNGP